MKIKYLKTALLVLFFSASTALFSQNIGINYSGAAPDVNAILDLNTGNNGNLGLIIPNVGLTNTATVFSPPIAHAPTAHDVGLMVYNNAATLYGTGFYYWNGSTWVSISSGLANNGVTATGGIVQLGGSLIQNTSVTASSSNYMMNFDLGTGSSAGTGTFSITNGGSSNPYLTVKNSGNAGNPVQVGFGTNSPNPSATLDVTSTTGGVLYPRLTSAQISAINSPANGLILFNITTHCLELFAGEAWTNIACCNPPPPAAISGTAQYCSGSSGDIYTASAVSGATGYIWSMQPSVSGSNLTGNGTQATANFASTPQTYTISVADSNFPTCISANTTFTVAMGSPPAAPATPSGPSSVVINSSSTYTIATSPGYSYTWSSSNTNVATVSNAVAGSATVAFGATGGTTNICVYSSINGCNSSPSCISVTSSVCNLTHGTATYTYTGSAATFTVGCGISSVTITAYGAAGGTDIDATGGLGAEMIGTFTVSPAQVLTVVVGGEGVAEVDWGSGGGGGSGVSYSGTPWIVAGGGGGRNDGGYADANASTTTSGYEGQGCCSYGGAGGTGGGNGGGVGYPTAYPTGPNLAQGGYGFNQGSGGTTGLSGVSSETTYTAGIWGLGGGGGGVGSGYCNCGGGGGGYSGGGAGGINGDGGGGGSYNNGTNQTNNAGVNSGNGEVLIQY